MSADQWWLDQEQLRLFEERLAAIRVDRRSMLRYAAAAGGVSMAAIAAACGPAAPPAPAAPAQPTQPASAGAAPTTAPAAAPAAAPTQAPAAASSGPSTSPATGLFRFPMPGPTDALSHDFNFDLYCQGEAALFAGLGKFDAELKVVPDMAEGWESNADGSVWTFHMRKGAKWTNGDPVTAQDFEWSFKRQLDPATKAPYAGFLYDLKNGEAFNKGGAGITRDSVGIKATDDNTLVATMEGPRGYFPVLAAYTAALPAHRASVEKYGDGDKWTTADKIVSNGPFKLTAWERDRYWETVKNPDYWNAANVKLQKTYRPLVPYD